jgi:hypothetical protein
MLDVAFKPGLKAYKSAKEGAAARGVSAPRDPIHVHRPVMLLLSALQRPSNGNVASETHCLWRRATARCSRARGRDAAAPSRVESCGPAAGEYLGVDASRAWRLQAGRGDFVRKELRRRW